MGRAPALEPAQSRPELSKDGLFLKVIVNRGVKLELAFLAVRKARWDRARFQAAKEELSEGSRN